jgi:broad specificity phosphatase PhoE
MHDELPVIYLARHGDTARSITGWHTGLTDMSLTPQGEEHARGLREPLRDIVLPRVPNTLLPRARTTRVLAGFTSVAEVDNDLASIGHFIPVLAARLWDDMHRVTAA